MVGRSITGIIKLHYSDVEEKHQIIVVTNTCIITGIVHVKVNEIKILFCFVFVFVVFFLFFYLFLFCFVCLFLFAADF